MVKVLLDVAAESGGAVSVLEDYYEKVKDTNEQWLFILSGYDLLETQNIKVKRVKWIKKSWFHRLFFDLIILPIIIYRLKPKLIFSLQNTIAPFTKVRQELFLHQSLPYTSIKFKFFEEPKLWIYQNIIKIFINNSARKADIIYVQTKWIAKELVEQTKISPDKIKVIKTEINLLRNKKFCSAKANGKVSFFYPAAPLKYKNHQIVIESLSKLKKEELNKVEIYFTLESDMNTITCEMSKKINELSLPIHFIGYLSKIDVEKMYESSILLFPSYIETLGLPLMEARMKETPIIASDTEFSREVLDGYDNAEFFSYDSAIELTKIIQSEIR
ncbi:glycosyltransferase [Aerococcus tenax]|uniref:glycosyltransferase n=1 Tax=Aerococcus tenax TaxID=3078812 RepID=UPI0018A77954|nr:glycosyltransferase [Aerococcus tenax]